MDILILNTHTLQALTGKVKLLLNSLVILRNSVKFVFALGRGWGNTALTWAPLVSSPRVSMIISQLKTDQN